jgi:hypothetical protein
MSKYCVADLQKALTLAKNSGEISVTIDPKERLIILFTDIIDEMPNEITIYPSYDGNATKFAEIKITKKL